ncbi:MAG: hypothetical protein FWG45_04705, partial [Oscillospiraceae bacterium]|nr:hypothetical protein [Oscillospiraceae bacterium]
MTSPFKAQIITDGELTTAQAREKWEAAALSQSRRTRKRESKGQPLYVHATRADKSQYILYYHHSYGKDFCDTMFVGEIYAYDDNKCQVTGKVTASTAVRRF